MTTASKLARSHDISTKVSTLLQKRTKIAQEHYKERVQEAWKKYSAEVKAKPVAPWDAWTNGLNYAVDFAQRSVLFWDMLRQRGNNYLEHVQQGQPPLLHFEYETVVDGRTLERPVNYALLRIIPPQGVTVDVVAAVEHPITFTGDVWVSGSSLTDAQITQGMMVTGTDWM